MNDIPTIGEWYHSIPTWKRWIFNAVDFVTRGHGTILIADVLGYHRSMRKRH